MVKLANARRSQRTAQSCKASPAGKSLQKRDRLIANYAKRHGIQRAAEKFGLTESRVRVIAKQHRWQPAAPFDSAAILKDYLAGMKLFEIAAKFGCEQSYPTQLARRAGKKREPGVQGDFLELT